MKIFFQGKQVEPCVTSFLMPRTVKGKVTAVTTEWQHDGTVDLKVTLHTGVIVYISLHADAYERYKGDIVLGVEVDAVLGRYT